MTVRKSATRKALHGTARGDRAPPGQTIAAQDPEPQPQQPAPPVHLSADAQAEWIRLAPVARALGTLTAGDSRAFELLCSTLATAEGARRAVDAEGYTIATDGGGRKPHPCVRVMEAASNAAARLLHAFGLTPTGRAALDLSPAPPGLGDAGAPVVGDAFDVWRASAPPDVLAARLEAARGRPAPLPSRQRRQ
jgi:P27 family predicted phage terminase small subunit